MNMFPIIISWIPNLSEIYDQELRYSNYSFLAFYIVEALFKVIQNCGVCVYVYV